MSIFLQPIAHSCSFTSCICILQLTSLTMISPGTAENSVNNNKKYYKILTGIFVPQLHQSIDRILHLSNNHGLDSCCFWEDPQHVGSYHLQRMGPFFFLMLHQPNECIVDVQRLKKVYLERLSFWWINLYFLLVILRTWCLAVSVSKIPRKPDNSEKIFT